MIAASGTEIAPVAAAFTTPQRMSSCHGAVISVLSPAPTEIPSTATVITRRIPYRSTKAAAKGPPSPKTTRLIATAKPIVARLQPNSSCSGTIRTPVVERNPADVTSVKSPTAATSHA